MSESFSGRSMMNSVVAGYCAGMSGTLVGHPLDSIKVWKQTQSHRGATPLWNYNSKQGIRVIYQSPAAQQCHSRCLTSSSAAASTMMMNRWTNTTQTLRGLYAGVSGPLVTVGLIQAINFCIYDSTRRYLHQRDTGSVAGYLTDDHISNVALSGAVVGAASAAVTNPLLHIKVKQQVAAPRQLRYLDAVAHAVDWRGCARSALRNLYTGAVPHAASEITGRTVYFVTYEVLKRYLRRDRDDGQNTLAQRMMAASTSGVVCWCVIYPLDAMRSRMFATSKQSVVKTMHKMLAEGGWRAFYRGLGITLLRAGPVHAFVLPVYDLTLARLSQT